VLRTGNAPRAFHSLELSFRNEIRIQDKLDIEQGPSSSGINLDFVNHRRGLPSVTSNTVWNGAIESPRICFGCYVSNIWFTVIARNVIWKEGTSMEIKP
jgi:hypothetical protein